MKNKKKNEPSAPSSSIGSSDAKHCTGLELPEMGWSACWLKFTDKYRPVCTSLAEITNYVLSSILCLKVITKLSTVLTD